MESKYVGILLAALSSLLIGSSFILTKKGLMSTSGGTGDAKQYMQSPLWWAGLATMVLGEIANFAAYACAQAIVVAPLGALSVIISAVLASIFLQDELGFDGKLGSALSLLGSVVIVLNAPPDKEFTSIDEIMNNVLSPGFLFYCIIAIGVTLYFIYYLVEPYGRRTPLIYVTICSLAGSITVTAAKALGLALKLTFAGSNQFGHIATYFFILVTAGCILLQMNYFNRALDTFSTAVVTPIYYVFFSSSTILASIILQQGIYDADTSDVLTMLIGFIIIFLGVWMINRQKAQTAARRQSLSHANGDTVPMVSRHTRDSPTILFQHPAEADSPTSPAMHVTSDMSETEDYARLR